MEFQAVSLITPGASSLHGRWEGGDGLGPEKGERSCLGRASRGEWWQPLLSCWDTGGCRQGQRAPANRLAIRFLQRQWPTTCMPRSRRTGPLYDPCRGEDAGEGYRDCLGKLAGDEHASTPGPVL